jgi:hypothetical protein
MPLQGLLKSYVENGPNKSMVQALCAHVLLASNGTLPDSQLISLFIN